ncbi:MAG: extracellular solute-binding protein [Actinomycetia bacterium]|nr:extracellular solute-binding protein [Actinomycetes bacterium]
MAVGAGAVAVALSLTGCSSGNTPASTSTSTSGAPTSSSTTSSAPSNGLSSSSSALTILFGSSGDAETKAMQDAATAWSATSGTQVTVTTAANMDQEMAQGFAGGKPADVFYLGTGVLAGYADAGNLLAYGDLMPNKADFYPSLVANFTYKGKFYCAPKDFSTLGLIINTDMWAAAGLTDADYPTTWEQLHAVAKRLTTGGVTGIIPGGQYERLGAFMVQNGSNLMSPDGTKVTAADQSNIDALAFVKTMLADGSMKFAADVSAGWGGEAFGTGKAAMTIEGNWITGAMNGDYKNIKWKAVPLPTGPSGKKGTLQFTNCWGIAAASPNQQAALKLVEFMTTKDQQMKFSQAFGVLPSIQSAAADYKAAYPNLSIFMDAVQYAQGVPTLKGSSDVLKELNNNLGQLATSDPATILNAAQTQLQALMK